MGEGEGEGEGPMLKDSNRGKRKVVGQHCVNKLASVIPWLVSKC